MNMLAASWKMGSGVDEKARPWDNGIMQPHLDPWNLAYWKSELQSGRAPSCLDPGSFHNLSQVNLALEAAFDLRDWEAAQHIAGSWQPYFNPNTCSNNAHWINREMLFFLRGKTEIKWLDLLLHARASMSKDNGMSFLVGALEEINKQLEESEADGVERFFELVPRFLANGAVCTSDHLLDLTQEKVESVAPEHMNNWKAMREKIAKAEVAHVQCKQIEKRLESAISENDPAGITVELPAFLALPRSLRTFSPLEKVLCGYLDESCQEDLICLVRTLIDSGLPLREVDAAGKSPLNCIIEAELAPIGRQEIVSVLLAAGADPNQRNEVSWSGEYMPALDTPLHGCSILFHPPVEQLLAAGAELEARDDRGMTPLLYACRESNLEAISMLLQAGANVETTSEYGGSAAFEYLSNLMQMGKKWALLPVQMAEGCKMLALAGADLCPSFDGKTAWEALFQYIGATLLPEAASKISTQFISALLSSKLDLDWNKIHDAALAHEFTGPACAAISHLLISRETSIALPSHGMRRM